MRILLADDHAILRHGLKDILAKEFPMAVFGEADTAQAALEQVWKHTWDVVVMDVSMPGRSGVDVLKEIKQSRPKLPVLLLSMHPEEHYAVRALKAGASGYLTKVKAPIELVGAVKMVLAGGKYISATTAEKLAATLTEGSEKPPHERLSDREFQIMRMIASGMSLKETAAELSISLQTASTHRARLMKKMGMQTTTELIRYALQNNLVE